MPDFDFYTATTFYVAASPSVAFYSTQDTSVLPQSNLCSNLTLFTYLFAIPYLLECSWIHVLPCFHHSQDVPDGKQSERLAVFV